VSRRRAALIVLAWNQWPTTRRCLDSLLATAPQAAEVIVVDNGSSDETPHALAAYADRVTIVTLPENLGFVRGMNAGIAAAHPDEDVVLLNNDLEFRQADWLDRLRDAAYAAPENGIVGCRQRGPDEEGRLYHAGGFIEGDDLWGQQTETGTLERDVGQYTMTRRVQGIAFALAYLRRDCIERIGSLDTLFHSYFEDTDYCLRAAEAGIATVVAGAVTVQHEQHGSTRDDGGFRQRLWQASRAAFAARWQQRLRADYRGNVLWQGATHFPHAHAQLTRLLVRRLDARGLRMAYAAGTREIGSSDDFRLDLAARRRWSPPADAALVCGPAPSFAGARGRARIGIGIGEWERVSPEWGAACRSLDCLVVPDTFQRDAFSAAGVRVPIEVVPFGVDRDYCHPGVPTSREPDARFVFLAVAEDLARDAPDLLVRAFRAAFGAEDAPILLIHVRPGRDAFTIQSALREARGGDERIRVLPGWGYPWYQRAQLIAAADAYVSARRGGGWDPFAAETLACGRILLATDFGSQAELVRAHGFAIDGAVATDAHTGLHWAEPAFDALVTQLRHVHANRAELRACAHAHAQAFARAHDIEASADRLAQLVGDLAGLAPPRALPPPHRPLDLARPPSGQMVVLGMHRSGTSSVAGLLARMGVAVGPEHDLLVGPDNPKGHYESARLHMACVRRLAAAGGDWRSPPSIDPAAAIDAFRREVGALVDEFDARRPWLFKEPRLCLLARELLPLLTRPLFVHVVRDPLAVAASLAARDGFAPVEALALWERYTRDAFEASRGWPRLIVDYDALCADPHATTRALHDGLRALGLDDVHMPSAEVLHAWIDAPVRDPHARAAQAELSGAQRALRDAIADRSILQETPRRERPASLHAGAA
jgi:GT2 family glycosyltransferase/glycosyltransferase involved in cell wall biosynthesis